MLIALLFVVFFQNIVPSSQEMWATDGMPDRLTMEVRLTGYSNPTFNLSGSYKCACNDQNECDDWTGQCLIRFSFAAYPGPYELIHQSGFGYMDKNGELSNESKSLWASNFTQPFRVYPYFLRVTAEHIGSRMNMANGQIETSDNVTQVDVFFIHLPIVPNMQSPTVRNQTIFTDLVVKGHSIDSKISLQLSLKCMESNMIGLDCDMKCFPSFASNSLAVCNPITGNGPTELYEYKDNGHTRFLGECSKSWMTAVYCHADLVSFLNSIKYEALAVGLVLIFGIVLLVTLTYFDKEQTIGSYVKKAFKKENNCVNV